MELFFDTETTGKPKRYDAPVSDVDNYPRLVQLGYIVTDGDQTLLETEILIYPNGFEIPEEASRIHGVTTERARREGLAIKHVLLDFVYWIGSVDLIVGHNVDFDVSVVGAEYWRLYESNPFSGKKTICTMKSSTNFVGLPGKYGFKYPKLSELYLKLFGMEMGAAHTALQDIQNTVKCYRALVDRGIIK